MNAHSKIDHETLVNMTSDGHVQIPKSVRDRNGLMPNAAVWVGINDRGETVVLPGSTQQAESPEERVARVRVAVEALRGKFSTGRSTDEQMRDLRGDWEP